MAKYIRGRTGYSQRSGRKVRYDRLVEDGHIKGLYVDISEVDEEHPLERPQTPVDIQPFRPIPPNDKNVARADIGYMKDVENPDLHLESFRESAILGGFTTTVTPD